METFPAVRSSDRFASLSAVATALLVSVGLLAGCPKRQPGLGDQEAKAVQEAAPGDLQATLEEAEAHWEERLDAAQLERAIELYEEAAKLRSAQDSEDEQRLKGADIQVRLARAYQFHVDAHADAQSDPETFRHRMHEKGLQAAKRAAVLFEPELKDALQGDASLEEALKDADPAAVPGLYWHAIHLGQWAMQQGVFTAMKYRGDIESSMQFVCKHDSEYFHGGCYRYWGAYWTRLPVGKDAAKSLKNFKKAIEVAPYYQMNRVVMAEHYAVLAEKKQRFRTLLEAVLASEPDDARPEIQPENRLARRKASELLNKIDQYF